MLLQQSSFALVCIEQDAGTVSDMLCRILSVVLTHRMIARRGLLLVTFIRPTVRIAGRRNVFVVVLPSSKSTKSGAVNLFAVADINRKSGHQSNLL